jgi:hypothetical protein
MAASRERCCTSYQMNDARSGKRFGISDMPTLSLTCISGKSFYYITLIQLLAGDLHLNCSAVTFYSIIF